MDRGKKGYQGQRKRVESRDEKSFSGKEESVGRGREGGQEQIKRMGIRE